MNRIGGEGAKEIFEAMKYNSTLTSLDMSLFLKLFLIMFKFEFMS